MGSAAFLGAFATSLAVASPAIAREEITRFESTVTVERDASLMVEEKITVNAEGIDIRRGIYRDFPTRYLEPNGVAHTVGFQLLSVERDGKPEPHFTEGLSEGVRIYAGEESVFLDYGEHTYTFRYRTTRQLRYFKDYDEVYWNATGNFWTFPIRRAVARILLPEGGKILQKAAYTGRAGEKGTDYRVSGETGRSIMFETTRTLGPGEGLTVAVGFPKGLVEEPGALSERLWSMWDNKGFLLLLLGAVAAGLYYFRTWLKVGRDPQSGTIIPLFYPPKNLSPAAVSYVHYQGFANAGRGAMRAFIAALMALAVKGRLRIDAEGEDVAIETAQRSNEPLPRGEAVIMSKLLSGRDRFEFTKAYGTTIATTQSSFRSAILKEHEGVFFNNNYGYFIIGAGFSIAALAAYLILQYSNELTIVSLIFGFALALIGTFLLSMGWRRILGLVPGGGSKLLGVLLALVGLAVFLASLFTPFGANGLYPVIAVLAGIVIAALNVAFFHLLRAPTTVGRKAMDDIEGFRLYLSVAEAERMNLIGGPEMSPQLFEKYLPYAVALGVEKPWSEAFEAYLARVMPDRDPSESYQPRWYRGSGWTSGGLGRATTGIVGSVATGIAASVPTKSSSGSGGGGFSGGGGGGGGGGGW